MGLTISSPMDAESLRDLLLAQPHATEETPFAVSYTHLTLPTKRIV